MDESSVEEFDEPFFHAPVLMDGVMPSSGFAPLYEESIPYEHEMKMNNDIIPLWTDQQSDVEMTMNMGKNVPFNINSMNEDINPMFMVNNETPNNGNFPFKGVSQIPDNLFKPNLLSTLSMSVSKENDSESKRAKKKRKKNTDELPPPSELSNIETVQNILVNFDSNLFDEYISQVSKFRDGNLTKEETNIIKDIRRRIKNRESARKCRQNRKNKLETLEEKIKNLSEETHALQEDISSYKKENQCLAEEVKYLQNIINNNPIFSTIFQEYSNAPSDKRQEVLVNSISSQSFFLLAVMFSFGIVFNVDSNGNSMPLFNRGFFRDRGDMKTSMQQVEIK